MENKKYKIEEYKMTVAEVATLLNMHIQYVRILARKGKIPAYKFGGQWRFCKQELIRQLREDTENSINKEEEIDEKGIAKTSDLFQ